MSKAGDFWHWLYQEDFLWIKKIHELRRPILSKADWFGVAGIILMFSFIGLLIATIITQWLWFLAGIPVSVLSGTLSIEYAIYLEEEVLVLERKHE